MGPADEDKRIVQKALEEGEISSGEIKALREAEQDAVEAMASTAEGSAAPEDAQEHSN